MSTLKPFPDLRAGPAMAPVAMLAAMIIAAAPAGALTATPTATRPPCDTGGTRLELHLAADPPAPTVGDVVDLVLDVGYPDGGLAGLPTYSLSGAEPVFSAELVEYSSPYAGDARYRLTALQAGRATLQASIHYETSHSCFGGQTFFFRSSTSDPLVIDVGAAGGPTATPTATPTASSTATPTETTTDSPTPTSNRPPPVAVIDVTPNPARAGDVVSLDSRRSSGAINGRYWNQLDGPPVVLEGCLFQEYLGCYGAAVTFVAPPVAAAAVVRIQLLLTSYGSTPGDARDVEIEILPLIETPMAATGTPLASPTATASPTPTDTPAPTPIDTAASPTATPLACFGDCSGDGVVSIDELIRGVSIALGSSPLATCQAVDGSGDGAVTIEELVAALRSALDGCPLSRPDLPPGSV